MIAGGKELVWRPPSGTLVIDRANDLHLIARTRAGGACVELVESSSTSGTIGEQSTEDILCRYFTPAQLAASVSYARCSPRKLGRVMFIPAGVGNRVRGSVGQVSAIVCRFDHSWLSRRGVLPACWSEDLLGRCNDLSSARADHATQWLAAELRDPGFAAELTIDSLVGVIAVEIARHFNVPGPDRPGLSCAGRMTPGQLRRLRDHVESCSHCPAAEELAALFGCSPVHLRRLCKASTGRTLRAYVEEVRLNRARDLLIGTDRSIGDISRELGFAHQSAFSTAFSRGTGWTAFAFRASHRR